MKSSCEMSRGQRSAQRLNISQITKSMLSKWIKARDDMEKIVKSRRRLVLRLGPTEVLVIQVEEEEYLYQEVVMKMRKTRDDAVSTFKIQQIIQTEAIYIFNCF